MSKHTPGPWSAHPFSSVVGCPISAQPDKTKNTVVIAGAHGAASGDYRAEVEANARLIAAAPELLEAVQRARRHAMNIGIDSGSYFETLDAAIAKATDAG